MSGYCNRYEDFIESQRLVGINEQGLMVFQSQNVAEEAEIYGVDARAGMDLGELSDVMAGLLAASLGLVVEGRRPQHSCAAVLYRSASRDPRRGLWGAWSLPAASRAAMTKRRRQASSKPPVTACWTCLDTGLSRRVPSSTSACSTWRIAKYWDAGDVPAGVLATSAVLDRYTSPGRNVGVSMSFSW